MTTKPVSSREEISPDHPDVPVSHVDIESDVGHVHIHNNVVATIARMAAQKVPGVVEMSGGVVDSLAGIIGKKGAERGVRVEVSEQGVKLFLHVVVEYGSRIPTVAGQIQEDVRRAVEHMTGKGVQAVEVIIEGIRIPSDQKPQPPKGIAG